jgi:transcriptional regulator with XRE-family HTH domain
VAQLASDARVLLGRAVRKRRLKLGLSQERLGEAADLHRTYIADVERGARNLSLLSILKISQALRTTPSRLLEGIR